MAKDKKNKAGTPVPQGQFVFGKQNYQLMLIGLAVIILGFVLMYGKEGDIYDFRRITLAPIVVMAGFVIEIFAILRKPKSE
jgi:hypothetical protein